MKLYYIKINFLLLAFSLSFWTCREEKITPEEYGSIVGVVLLDTDENIEVRNATISTNPPTSSIFTDSLGRFSFDSIQVNTYTLRAEKNQFVTALESVTVFPNQTANVIIRLRPDSLDNIAPDLPSEAIPFDGATAQDINLTLEWSATDEDESDVLTYDVKIFNSDQTENELIAQDIEKRFVNLENLEYNQTYFWQVTVKDGNTSVNGPVWQFKTKEFPDHRFLYVRESNGKFDIYSSDAFGSEIRLTNNSGSNWRPKMNPNRTKIAYISNIGLEPQLYLMNRDGSNAFKITNIPITSFNNFEIDYCWSPNGAKLLYMNASKLYAINTDGTGLELINEAPEGFVFTTCDWTAQNERMVVRTTGTFNYNSEAYLLDGNGVYLQRILNDVEGSTGGVEFSIDGHYVLYTEDVSGFESADGRQLDSHMFLLNLNNLTTTDLSFLKPAGTNDLDPHFSPDGSKIIFVNTNNDGISPKNIYFMDVDGSTRTLLFENAVMPEWK